MDAYSARYLLDLLADPGAGRCVSSHGKTGALCYVETRPAFFGPHVVASAVRSHPGWPLYLFGSEAMIESILSAMDAICGIVAPRPKIHKYLLDIGGRRLNTPQYNRLLTSTTFWSKFAESHVLVFQLDSVVLRPVPEWAFDKTYIGAVCFSTDPETFVMNGGLSFRDVDAMRAVVQTRISPTDENEDVVFCRELRALDRDRFPTIAECDAFAIESWGNPDTVVGVHGTDKYYADPDLLKQAYRKASLEKLV